MIFDTESIALLISYVLVWIVVAFLTLVVLELLRQIAQIRTRLGLDDRPLHVSMGALTGEHLSRIEAPMGVIWSELMPTGRGALVFLSHDCGSCRNIAPALNDFAALPEVAVIPIVYAREGTDFDAFIDEMQIPRERTIIDYHGKLAKQLGIDVRPSVLLIEEGRIRDAAVVSAPRQLRTLIAGVAPGQDAANGLISSSLKSLGYVEG